MNPQTRRQFLKTTASATAAVAGAPFVGESAVDRSAARNFSIVFDPTDDLVKQPPVQWAAEELRQALQTRGITAQVLAALEQAPPQSGCIAVASHRSALARQILNSTSLLHVAESSTLQGGKIGGRDLLLASGSDARGIVYALLELADRVKYEKEPIAALRNGMESTERPANAIRSVTRCFTSDVHDKPWFNDRGFWRQYLTMLTTQRYNRFSLTLGIGYDYPMVVRDCYLHFAYPFLVSVPGYNVRAVPLPDSEREQNLEMLKFIGDETARRGLQFHLGLWTHVYQWPNSPNISHRIQGLTPETHAPYCRDALTTLLNACPAINGLTFRIHGESGVAEGTYEFWSTVFDGVVKCGRRIEIDLHAKGIDQKMIDLALATDLPVTVAPKFWAEHMGLPYMQAAIRPLEMPPRQSGDNGFFSKSSGSRRFLRYGYGDLLSEDRRYGVLHRIWPGTQRVLLWGDPVFAAAYSQSFSFCGSDGVEICEPLSFKGRKGSGIPGGRDSYADESLRTSGGGWEKYLYTYRVWGRHLYNPNCDADVWRRLLRKQFGKGAEPAEAALGNATRILPIVTTAHCPSAANNAYWPELYSNMPIVDASRPHPYGDTLSPKRFGTVSPLDPELFSRIDDFAQKLLPLSHPMGEGPSVRAKYSPAEVAQWLENRAEEAAKNLQRAIAKTSNRNSPEFRRLSVDVAIQCGLGHFFAWKLRAGVLYSLYTATGDRAALEAALKAYRTARRAWAELAESAKGIYLSDITFGHEKHLRGHWLDRLPAIDADIADMEKKLAEPPVPPSHPMGEGSRVRAIREILTPIPRPDFQVRHIPSTSFRRGQPVMIEASLSKEKAPAPEIILRYRRVNQAEIWRSERMLAHDEALVSDPARVGSAAQTGRVGDQRSAFIPAEYTDSPFPLQYFFELRDGSGAISLYPGLGPNLATQPYFTIRSA